MTNIEIIQDLYRAFAAKDYAAFTRLSARDLEWVQNEGFPGGATHHGPQAVIDGVFKAFDDVWESFSFETERMLDASDTVIVIGAYKGRHRATGKAFRSATAHVYELKAGKLVRYRQFADTKVIWDAMS